MTDRELLRQTAEQLEKWADETERGAWSTQHVAPMRAQAQRIFAQLGRAEPRMQETLTVRVWPRR